MRAGLIGFLRQDTISDKVYFRNLNDSVHLIFDFSLSIGDTLTSLVVNGAVSGIDSIFTSIGIKKRYFVDPGLSLSHLQYAESVGYLYGDGLLNGWQYLNVGIHKDFRLICMKSQGNLVYQQGASTCALDFEHHSTSIEEKQNTHLIVYPNPVQNVLTLESLFYNSVIKILDIRGGVIESYEFPNSIRFQMNVSSLQTGVYILQIKGELGQNIFCKFLKM